MAFTYGSEALNQLAQEVSREPADLSTKADVTALATTNAVVATKQTLGEPPRLAFQFVPANATQDPDFAVEILQATTGDVTLTLVDSATVSALNYRFLCGDDSGGRCFVTAAGTDQIVLPEGPGSTVELLKSGYCLTLLSLGNGFWIPTDVIDTRPRVAYTDKDTTGTDMVTPLSLADARTAGQVQVFKNTGTGTHTLTVNRAGSDTINGGTTGIVLADGKAAMFWQTAPGAWVTIAGL